ncbi:MAG: aminoglycoside phosphotransferase family protein [Propionibacteriaceae bacterium]|jgi:aminoglycoside phosphotransferase (APT) family kinase protein|nr:aminoglycoside phosphotransferase family protein [Propionibacteriaceae bacterium]
MSSDPAEQFPRREDLDVRLVARLVAGQFPRWAGLPVARVVVDGWDNTTFRLGTDLSVRLPSAEAYKDQVQKEHRWLPELAPQLPLPIPVPLAMGAPAAGYPWNWSVYRWLEGETASAERIDDPTEFGATLGRFLTSLQQIDPTGGPPPGLHNFFRGAPLQTYDAETRTAIRALRDEIAADTATAVWEQALGTVWDRPPVWFHGDVSAGNLLVRDGRLSAVIDFGCSGVGDPACDLTIAWTLLSGEGREAFRSAVSLDTKTWQRGRGWALWKALITVGGHRDPNSVEGSAARRVIEEVLAEVSAPTSSRR